MKNFGKIISDKDIITKEYLDSRGYISAITSKMVTDALGFTPFDSAAFTKTSIKNALGIADWALAANKPSYDDVYLKLSGGTLTGQLYVENSVGDRYIHSKCDTAHIAFGVGSGGTNRGIFDMTLGKWWIVRGASEHTDINGTLAVTGAITAKGGMLMNGQGITKWADVGNYISLPYLNINAKLLPTNTFDTGGQLAINFLQNAIYSADKRFTIEHTGDWFEYADYKFFDGNYDSFCQISAGSTGVLTISNNGGNLIQGYPYGDIYLSFYNTNIPDSATVEVYCNYASQGIGWKTLSRTSTRGSRNGVWVYSNSYYNVTQLRITMTASASSSIALCQIDWFLTRASLSNLPVVTKFAIDQELWGRLICKSGITLGNTTITSWDDLKASGDYLPLTGGTITGNLTVNGKISGTTFGLSTSTASVSFLSNIFALNASLQIESGWVLRLAGEGITSWAGLKNYLSFAFSDIGSKPTTLSGYGITDALPKSGGNLSGPLTVNGKITGSALDISTTSGYVKFSSNILYVYASLQIESGWNLRLAGEGITSWDDLRIKEFSQTTTNGTVSIAPNVLNKWSSVLTGTLTITFASGKSGIANYYMLEFTTGSSIPTINLPSGVKWEGGYNILNNLAANTTYQISVLNNLAVGGAFV